MSLGESLDQLTEADPATLSDSETVLELERMLAKLEAVTVRAVGLFADSGEWGTTGIYGGAFGPTAWLTGNCKLPVGTARRQVRLGHAMPHLPALARSWFEGRITSAQVERVDKVRRFETEDLLARDETMLVEQAEKLSYDYFSRAVHYWEQLADPNGSERSAHNQRALRDVFLSSSFDGMWLGKMTLDPISGAIVSQELERIEGEMFKADWAEAKARLGYEPCTAHLSRQPQQRRADALVEMATRSGSCSQVARRPDPLFTVLVDYPTLHGRICELAQGAAVTPGSLVPWIDQAYIERAVFSLGNRVEVSERARLFTGATRRALEIRDRGCSHPLCDEQVQRCQADHIEPFSEGGLTVQENGRLLCGFHNRLAYNERKERPPPDG
jgi:hypothetical protein